MRGEPDRVGVLDDGDGGRGVVTRDAVGGIEVEQVVERRPLALQLGRVGQRPAAVRRLAVERRALMRVLAIAQVVDLLEDDGQAARERVAGDLVEVGGDLGVVGGDRAERLRRQARPGLGAHPAQLAQLGHEEGVVRRVRCGRDTGGVAGRRTEQGRATDVDHLDRLVDADELGPDGRGERLDVDDDQVDEADALALELVQLFGLVTSGEDAGVDRVVERLDLAADGRLALGQGVDRGDLDAFRTEVFAGPVGRVHLHPEIRQISGKRRDAGAIRDRQQGSQPGPTSHPARFRRSGAAVSRPSGR